jgi:hypothetical protein
MGCMTSTIVISINTVLLLLCLVVLPRSLLRTMSSYCDQTCDHSEAAPRSTVMSAHYLLHYSPACSSCALMCSGHAYVPHMNG